MHGAKEPVRMCAICRVRLPKSHLARFVPGQTESGTGLVPDPAKIKPGRGYYVCDMASCQKKFAGWSGWRKKLNGGRHGE